MLAWKDMSDPGKAWQDKKVFPDGRAEQSSLLRSWHRGGRREGEVVRTREHCGCPEGGVKLPQVGALVVGCQGCAYRA